MDGWMASLVMDMAGYSRVSLEMDKGRPGCCSHAGLQEIGLT